AQAWTNFSGYLICMAVVGVIALIPLLIVSLMFLMLGCNLIFIITITLLIYCGMVIISTLFMVDVRLLHRVGPIRAFRISGRIGQIYFGQIARFALTSIFVLLGAIHLWSHTVNSISGMLIALIANAVLGTTFTFASMLYYTDRMRHNRIRQSAA